MSLETKLVKIAADLNNLTKGTMASWETSPKGYVKVANAMSDMHAKLNSVELIKLASDLILLSIDKLNSKDLVKVAAEGQGLVYTPAALLLAEKYGLVKIAKDGTVKFTKAAVDSGEGGDDTDDGYTGGDDTAEDGDESADEAGLGADEDDEGDSEAGIGPYVDDDDDDDDEGDNDDDATDGDDSGDSGEEDTGEADDEEDADTDEGEGDDDEDSDDTDDDADDSDPMSMSKEGSLKLAVTRWNHIVNNFYRSK